MEINFIRNLQREKLRPPAPNHQAQQVSPLAVPISGGETGELGQPALPSCPQSPPSSQKLTAKTPVCSPHCCRGCWGGQGCRTPAPPCQGRAQAFAILSPALPGPRGKAQAAAARDSWRVLSSSVIPGSLHDLAGPQPPAPLHTGPPPGCRPILPTGERHSRAGVTP